MPGKDAGKAKPLKVIWPAAQHYMCSGSPLLLRVYWPLPFASAAFRRVGTLPLLQTGADRCPHAPFLYAARPPRRVPRSERRAPSCSYVHAVPPGAVVGGHLCFVHGRGRAWQGWPSHRPRARATPCNPSHATPQLRRGRQGVPCKEEGGRPGLPGAACARGGGREHARATWPARCCGTTSATAAGESSAASLPLRRRGLRSPP